MGRGPRRSLTISLSMIDFASLSPTEATTCSEQRHSQYYGRRLSRWPMYFCGVSRSLSGRNGTKTSHGNAHDNWMRYWGGAKQEWKLSSMVSKLSDQLFW